MNRLSQFSGISCSLLHRDMHALVRYSTVDFPLVLRYIWHLKLNRDTDKRNEVNRCFLITAKLGNFEVTPS